LTPYFLLTFRTILTVVLLWILSVSVHPLSKLETFPLLTSVMSQALLLQQSASRLKITPANLWSFSINITSLLRIHSLCLNLLSYSIIVLPVLFYYLVLNYGVVLVLVLVLVYLLICTLSVLACYRPLYVGKHPEIEELN
jgi:hypothetical protein